MRAYLLIYIGSLLCFTNLFGQVKSILYNEKGQLVADTNYKISQKQLDKFIPVENYLIKFISDHIDYPEKSKEIIDTGNVIVSFKIRANDTLQEVRIEKTYEKKNYLSNEVLKVFKTIRIPKPAYSKRLRKKKYFIAINFELRGIDGVKYHKHSGVIQIIKYKTPLIERQ